MRPGPDRFQVAVRHGQGYARSEYYKVGHAQPSPGLAQLGAEIYAESHPEHDGWNVDVAVLDLLDDDNVIITIRDGLTYRWTARC